MVLKILNKYVVKTKWMYACTIIVLQSSQSNSFLANIKVFTILRVRHILRFEKMYVTTQTLTKKHF